MSKLLDLLKTKERENYVEKLPEDIYKEVAAASGFEPEEIAGIGGIESTHGKFSKPLQGGSARGLFQFQPITAEGLIPGSSSNIDDMNMQAELMKTLIRRNDPTSVEGAYIRHNLGKRGGQRVLDAEEGQKLKDVISARSLKSNRIYDPEANASLIREILKEKIQSASEGANFDMETKLRQLLKEKRENYVRKK